MIDINMIDIHDTKAIDQLRSELRFDPQCIRRLRTAYFKKFKGRDEASACLPDRVRDEFARRVRFHALQLRHRYDSQLDGSTKLLFRTSGGYTIETVILRVDSGRTSVCISSQVGCASNCEFCATGKMGVAHNLTAAEILDQIVQAGQLLRAEGRSGRNIVLMGMGEPFHNEANLYRVLRALLAPELFHHTPRRIMVSTVGIPDAMVRSAQRFAEVNLALSLHSTCQEVRGKIIPLARRYPLDHLQEALRQINAIQPGSVMIEYLMLAGVNDSPSDARQLIEWLDGLRVHVNLIPFNPIEDAPHLQSTDREGRDAFASILKSAGLPTTIRFSFGTDIAAACGQLVRKENRGLRKKYKEQFKDRC